MLIPARKITWLLTVKQKLNVELFLYILAVSSLSFMGTFIFFTYFNSNHEQIV